MASDHVTHFARLQPGRDAVVDDRPGEAPRRLTWAELDDVTARLAGALVGLGVVAGDRVLWCGANSLETVTMTHAIRRAGATSVPIPYRLTAEEMAYLVADSGGVVAWVDAAQRETFGEAAATVPQLRHTVVFGGEPGPGQLPADDLMAAAAPAPAASTGETRTMIYTSGTTGQPKGAVRRIEGAPGTTALLDLMGWRLDDVYLTTGPLYHSGPGGFAIRAHLLGATIVTQHAFDAEDWLRLLDAHRVTTTFSAPTPIRRICALPPEVKARYDVTSMRCMIANAAPWTSTLKRAYVRDFPPESLWEVYGSTELSVNTVLAPADQLTRPGSCGKEAPGVEIRLLDEDGVEVTEPLAPGELYVRSAGVFDAYHNRPDQFAADHRDGFQTVGDIAYRDHDGYLYICDRKRDLIISGGVNVYPAEVEEVLERHPDVHEAAVVGVADDDWGEAVWAVVVPEGPTLDPDELLAFAHEHLAGYKVPKRVITMDELPKTGSGKVLKRDLRVLLSG